jgi:hypothetical protein
MKYLVKVKYIEVTETVDGVEYTTETDEVESYTVKHKTSSRSKPRGGNFIFLESDIDLVSPVVATNEEDELILIEDPAKLEERVATKYKRDRVKEYPSVGDQLDMLYKTVKYLSDNGTDVGEDGEALITKVIAVKTKYPKPSGIK